jgi:hypothetical protein
MIKNAFLKFFGFKRKLSNQDASRRSPVDRVHISTISYVQTENSGARLVDESPVLSASSSWSSVYSASELNDDSIVYIPPSSIRYTNSTLKNTIIRIDSNDLDMIANSILTSPNILPKLQIVSHKGFYYAINNSSLQVYKRLEKRGDLTHVQADLVPLKAIPACIRDSFFAYGKISFNFNLFPFKIDNIARHSKTNLCWKICLMITDVHKWTMRMPTEPMRLMSSTNVKIAWKMKRTRYAMKPVRLPKLTPN